MSLQKSESDNRIAVKFRKPSAKDGADIWKLVKSTGNLDLNSAYSYLMLCKFFSDTCIVAQEEDQIIGFVSAFRQPQAQDTLFVWQVAVNESYRGKGIAKTLINVILSRDICENIHYVEATVSPSNIPSQSLFKGLAKSLKCPFEVTDCFSEELFPELGHEAEQTYRIGPF
jgi:L-2,4-diaminobutyric acid acetyltransferase